MHGGTSIDAGHHTIYAINGRSKVTITQSTRHVGPQTGSSAFACARTPLQFVPSTVGYILSGVGNKVRTNSIEPSNGCTYTFSVWALPFSGQLSSKCCATAASRPLRCGGGGFATVSELLSSWKKRLSDYRLEL